MAVAILIVTGLVMNLDFGMLRPAIERRLSQRLGRAVRIEALHRRDHGFHPTLTLENVRIAQPSWAGRGDMLRVRAATVTLRLGPLLIGNVVPESLELTGVRLALVRGADRNANWKTLPAARGRGGGSIRKILIHDGIVTLDDRARDHHLAMHVTADDRRFRIDGVGSLAGRPSSLAVVGAALSQRGAWPFRLDYRSPIANATLIGSADHPLDLGHFRARATGWGDDLTSLDRLIEAGLPATQRFRFDAEVSHATSRWSVRGLDGRIGRSAITLSIEVTKQAGRTVLDGDLGSTGFDFDDIASTAGLARAAAKRVAIGPRIFPDTAIDLEHLRRTDGVLRVDLRRLLSAKRSPFRAVRTTLVLDHGVLTAAPLTATLADGRLTGTAAIRHVSGVPRFTANLRLEPGRLEKIIPQQIATGTLSGMIRLSGPGRTIREAIGHADGSIGLVVRDGTIGRRAALFLGSDAGRALFQDETSSSAMRCLIMRFPARAGIAQAAPFLLDTDVARIEATGRIDLASERIALSLNGRPKLDRAIRIAVPVQVGGVLAQPKLILPEIPRTVGTALKLIGKAIARPATERPADVDCGALARQVLR